MKNKQIKLCAFLLILTLFGTLIKPAVLLAEPEQTESEETTQEQAVFEIRTTTDFETFAKNCRYDVWSENRTVILSADLVLSPGDRCFVPTFGGTFQGNGHKLSSLSITENRSDCGLFGTIREGAVVEDLEVSGNVEPAGLQKSLGGIAGINYGTIRNCHFSGVIKGDHEVGGIVGHNMASGTVSGCRAEGAISGNMYTGGIAGYNEGILSDCQNESSVNTTYSDVPISKDQLQNRLEQILISGKLNTYETISSRTDTGGICGFSAGVISQCKNHGLVGYEHTGYNVGGVTGRSSGMIMQCENDGEIFGRKDTGGIAGQLQPFMEADFSQMILDQLNTELDVLHGQVDTALANAGGYSADTSERLHRISGFTAAAKDSVKSISDDANVRADQAAAKANQAMAEADATSASISSAFADLSRISGEVSVYAQGLNQRFAGLEGQTDAVMADLELSEEEQVKFRTGMSDISNGLKLVDSGSAKLQAATAAASAEFNSVDNIAQKIATDSAYRQKWMEIMTQGSAGMSELSKGLSQASAGAKAVTDVMNNHPAFKTENGQSSKFYQDLQGLRAALNEFTAYVQASPDFAAELQQPLNTLTGIQTHLSDLQVSGISPEARAAEENLYSALSQMQAEMDALNSVLNQDAQESVGSFQDINDEINKISHLIEDGVRQAKNIDPNPEEHVEDISEDAVESAVEGRITASKNAGTIHADMNAGGVVGTIAVEYDLDPEEDIAVSGSSTLDYVLRVRSIVDASENSGTVQVRNDFAGGITGRMELGIIKACKNTGTIEAGGNYCGGIAGYSASDLLENTARSDLSATRYAGGIAGFGTRIKDSRAMVNIHDAVQYTGAIAGSVQAVSSGSISGNRFTSQVLYGIDGVNYAGIADNVTYQELFSDEVSYVALRFMADDQLIKTVQVGYGAALQPEDIPEIPEKEGFYGTWTRSDFSRIIADEVIRAEYHRIRTVLSSTVKRNSSSPLLLVEGNFRAEDEIRVSKDTPAAEELERWTVSFPSDGSEKHRIRFLLPDTPENTGLQVIQDGRTIPVGDETYGAYLIFETDETALTLAVYQKPDYRWVLILAVSVAGVILVLFLLRRILGRIKARKMHNGSED